MKGMQINVRGARSKMKLRNTFIALGVGTVAATSMSILKVNKNFVIGSTAVAIGSGLIMALRDEDNLNKNGKDYEYYFNRAQDKFEVANYKEAINDYNKVLELPQLKFALSTQCEVMPNVI